MTPLEDISLIGKNKLDLSQNESLVWCDLNEIKSAENFFPEFFKTELDTHCKEIKHIITVE